MDRTGSASASNRYWDGSKPYLDGFRATFHQVASRGRPCRAVRSRPNFAAFHPANASRLVNRLKDPITIQESPWLCKIDLLFNTQAKPFDNPKIRQALSMAVDRWTASDALSKITIVKPVGGPLLPGSPLALTTEELAELPGYRRDIEKSRAEAKRLLAEAGAQELKFKLINRNVNHPFTPVGVYMVDQFRRIGVTAEHGQLDVSQQKSAIANGDYQVAIDAFCGDTDDAGPLLLPYLSKER